LYKIYLAYCIVRCTIIAYYYSCTVKNQKIKKSYIVANCTNCNCIMETEGEEGGGYSTILHGQVSSEIDGNHIHYVVYVVVVELRKLCALVIELFLSQ